MSIVGKPVFTRRREVIKKDMPGDALGIAMEAIAITGILYMDRKREARRFTGIRPAPVNQPTVMHAEFPSAQSHRNLGHGSTIGEPSLELMKILAPKSA